MTRALIFAYCLLVAPTAQAASWQVVDMGRLFKERHCMEAATTTFQALLGEAQIGSLSASSWVAQANGINGRHDAVITCTHGDARGTRATLVLHSSGRAVDGHFLAQRIALLFEDRLQQITQAWKDSYK